MQNLAKKKHPSSVYKEGAHFYKDKKENRPQKRRREFSPSATAAGKVFFKTAYPCAGTRHGIGNTGFCHSSGSNRPI